MADVHVVPASVPGHVLNVLDPPLQAAPEHVTPFIAAAVLTSSASDVEPMTLTICELDGEMMPNPRNTTVPLSLLEQNHRLLSASVPPGPTCLLALNAGVIRPVAPVEPLALATTKTPGRPLADL